MNKTIYINKTIANMNNYGLDELIEELLKIVKGKHIAKKYNIINVGTLDVPDVNAYVNAFKLEDIAKKIMEKHDNIQITLLNKIKEITESQTITEMIEKCVESEAIECLLIQQLYNTVLFEQYNIIEEAIAKIECALDDDCKTVVILTENNPRRDIIIKITDSRSFKKVEQLEKYIAFVEELMTETWLPGEKKEIYKCFFYPDPRCVELMKYYIN